MTPLKESPRHPTAGCVSPDVSAVPLSCGVSSGANNTHPPHGNWRFVYKSAQTWPSQPAGPETVHLGHPGGFCSEQSFREKASMKIVGRRTPKTTWLRVLLSLVWLSGSCNALLYHDGPTTELKYIQEVEVLLHMFHCSFSLCLHVCLCAKWRFTRLWEVWGHLFILAVSKMCRNSRACLGISYFLLLKANISHNAFH